MNNVTLYKVTLTKFEFQFQWWSGKVIFFRTLFSYIRSNMCRYTYIHVYSKARTSISLYRLDSVSCVCCKKYILKKKIENVIVCSKKKFSLNHGVAWNNLVKSMQVYIFIYNTVQLNMSFFKRDWEENPQFKYWIKVLLYR